MHRKMKKPTFLICILLVSFTIQGQSIENLKNEQNSEIEYVKKEYFQNLQRNNDARIFSINEKRNDYTYKRLQEKRDNAALNYKQNSLTREQVKLEKQELLTVKNNAYRDSIANAIGYRRVSKAIENLEAKRKLEELRASNRREAFYRDQAINYKKETNENELKSKLISRHNELKKKYFIRKD